MYIIKRRFWKNAIQAEKFENRDLFLKTLMLQLIIHSPVVAWVRLKHAHKKTKRCEKKPVEASFTPFIFLAL